MGPQGTKRMAGKTWHPVLIGFKAARMVFYVSLATGRQGILVEWAWATFSEVELVESNIYRGNLTGK